MEENAWSVMGTGTIATEHMVATIRTIGHEPRWVISRNKEFARCFAEDTGIAHTSTDARRALSDPHVAFAYVSASRARRKYYVLAASDAKKGILCDGPLSASSKIAKELVAHCKMSGVFLAVNQPHRASTIHQSMRRLLQEGEIGKLQSVVIVRGAPFLTRANRRPDDENQQGEILLDVSVEDVDLVRFLTGEEIREVIVLPETGSGQPPQQMAFSARLSNEAIFQAYESFSAADIESIVMLEGVAGTLVALGTLSGKGTPILSRRIAGRNELTPVRERDAALTTVEEFVVARHRPTSWLATGEDSVKALRVIEAIAESAKKHRLVTL